ncbi:hypothetical protein HUT16_12180 [Kitasatospora sp. NA04385]|uniref:hypothetical protein n=1 Tax=Kitasatospora sp. NA04385 TaxID=2742135 RepID=UPI00159145BF|nr:hypothetical protein [Kitasatospora sp. NA04385]QKW19715.1 hypothetical protein HUT16_12180 [Kitasatospora sp. NA04385]
MAAAGFAPARPFFKGHQLIQPVYGIAAVQAYLAARESAEAGEATVRTDRRDAGIPEQTRREPDSVAAAVRAAERGGAGGRGGGEPGGRGGRRGPNGAGGARALSTGRGRGSRRRAGGGRPGGRADRNGAGRPRGAPGAPRAPGVAGARERA